MLHEQRAAVPGELRSPCRLLSGVRLEGRDQRVRTEFFLVVAVAAAAVVVVAVVVVVILIFAVTALLLCFFCVIDINLRTDRFQSLSLFVLSFYE